MKAKDQWDFTVGGATTQQQQKPHDQQDHIVHFAAGELVMRGFVRTDLQEFGDDRKHLRVADIDGVVPVRLLLVPDIPQVKDRRQ